MTKRTPDQDLARARRLAQERGEALLAAQAQVQRLEALLAHSRALPGPDPVALALALRKDGTRELARLRRLEAAMIAYQHAAHGTVAHDAATEALRRAVFEAEEAARAR